MRHVVYCYVSRNTATRFSCVFLRSLPYDDRLRQLGLWALRELRNRTDLIALFKLVKGFSSTPWNEFLHKSENNVTRGHSWKLLKNLCHCEARLQFFSQRVINRWNSLSQEDVDATSVNAFKRRLERRTSLKTYSLQVQSAARLLISIFQRLLTT